MMSLSITQLQNYWWFVVSLLGALFVFMMFVQGGQSLLFAIGKTETQKDLIINSLGRKWELTFTTLVLFGGACFAAFPLFYSTSFGGAYWVWLAILFCFIIQAVSYEYRKKQGNFLGQRTYEIFLFLNGTLGTILIGIAVATFFSGSDFTLSEHNFVIWQSPFRGLELLCNPFVFTLGFTVFFLARIGGALYLMNNIADGTIVENARRAIKFNTIPFLIFLVLFVVWLFLRDGFAYNSAGVVSMVKYKYFLNFIQMPILLILFLIGALLVLFSIFKGAFTSSLRGIFPFGLGVVLVVLSLFLIVGYNGTAFYPSFTDLQSSLTIRNASSSHYTLGVMTYVTILVPFVLAYIFYVWRAMDSKRLTSDEILNDEDSY